jgi:peptidoglycan L-alanyl-D-glutamate endopeptidase CwlK
MALDFTLLDPTFCPLAEQLIQTMKDKGYEINPYYGLRTLEEQAKFYRRSRPTHVVNIAIQNLRDQGCDYLADIMTSVGPQPYGPWATDALPGESYHEWGLAMDCLLTPGAASDYEIYAETARDLGLTAGYYFHDCDMGHVQLGSTNLPLGYNLKQINDYFVSHPQVKTT